MQRRKFLMTSAATAAVASAGCLDSLTGDDENGVPENGVENGMDGNGEEVLPEVDYLQSVPVDGANDSDGVLFINTQWDDFITVDDEVDEEDEEDIIGDEGSAQQVVSGGALSALSITTLTLSFGIARYQEVGQEAMAHLGLTGEQGINPDDVRVSEITMVDDAMVLEGDIDMDSMAESAENGFVEAGEVGEYTIYEGEEEDEDEENPMSTEGFVFAMSESALIFWINLEDTENAREYIEGILSVRAGDEPHFGEDNEDAAWAVSEASDSLLTIGGTDLEQEDVEEELQEEEPDEELPETLFERYDNAEVAINTFDLEFNPTELSSDFIAVFSDGETPSEDDLTEEFGEMGSSREITVDGNRMIIRGTW